MTPEQSFDLVALLEESRTIFESALEGVNPGRAGVRTSAESWSPMEIVEHVTVAERAMLGQLLQCELAEEGQRNPKREAQLYSQIRGRLSKVEAPERSRPAGRFENFDVARRQFAAARAQTIQFACDRAEELTRLSGQHMRFGPVNGAEMLVIVAAHSCRHAEQLAEAE